MAPHSNHPRQLRYPPQRHIARYDPPKLLLPLQNTTQVQLDNYILNAKAEASKNALIPRPMPCFYHTRGCDKTFDLDEELAVHVQAKITTDRDHEWCDECQLGFADHDDLKRHFVVAPNNIHHYCPVCGIHETKSPEAMHLHVQRSHKKHKLTCLGCGLEVNGAVPMLEHFKEGICSALQRRTDIVQLLPADGPCTIAKSEVDPPMPTNTSSHTRASSVTSARSVASFATNYTESGIRLLQPKLKQEKREKLNIHLFNPVARAALSYGFLPKQESLEEFGQRCILEGNASALSNIPWSSGMPIPTEKTAREIEKREHSSLTHTSSAPAMPRRRRIKLNSIPSAAEVREASAADALRASKALSAAGLQRITVTDVPLMPTLTPAKSKPVSTTSSTLRSAPFKSNMPPLREDAAAERWETPTHRDAAIDSWETSTHENAAYESWDTQTHENVTYESWETLNHENATVESWETPTPIPSLTWSEESPPNGSPAGQYWEDASD